MYIGHSRQKNNKPITVKWSIFAVPIAMAATAYSTDDGGLTCSFCGYHDAPQKEVVGKGAEEFEFTVETVARVRQRLGPGAQGTGVQQLRQPHHAVL